MFNKLSLRFKQQLSCTNNSTIRELLSKLFVFTLPFWNKIQGLCCFFVTWIGFNVSILYSQLTTNIFREFSLAQIGLRHWLLVGSMPCLIQSNTLPITLSYQLSAPLNSPEYFTVDRFRVPALQNNISLVSDSQISGHRNNLITTDRTAGDGHRYRLISSWIWLVQNSKMKAEMRELAMVIVDISILFNNWCWFWWTKEFLWGLTWHSGQGYLCTP